MIDCQTLNKTKITLPSENQILKFKNFKNKEKVSFVIYADLESILEKYDDPKTMPTKNKYQKHVPFSITYYLKCSYNDNISKFELYTGRDCANGLKKTRNCFSSC